ncbi:MAG: amidohydrolase family protein [Planctomycetota bacterium]
MELNDAFLNAPIIDAHIHMNADHTLDEEFLDVLRRWSACAVLSHIGNYTRYPALEEIREINDGQARFRDAHPDLLVCLAYINPQHGQEALDEMRRCVEELAMPGVKLWVARKANHPEVFPVIERGIEMGIFFLQHSWFKVTGSGEDESTPSDVAKLARRYSEARIIMAHIGGDWEQGIAAIRDCENVAVDTCGTDSEMGMVEMAVRDLGARRVVFGTDAGKLAARDFVSQLGKVMGAHVTEEERRLILAGNIRRYLQKSGGK